MNVNTLRLRASAQSPTPLKSSLVRCLICLAVCTGLFGCHRSEFGGDQSTSCPPPEGNIIVLDYTLNCLYVGDTPEAGCPEDMPNDYFYRETYICSERTGSDNVYLDQLIDLLLDVDAAIAPDLADTPNAQSDATLDSRPNIDVGVTETDAAVSTSTPEPEAAN